jgi:uncharacterized protein YukE
VGGYVLGGAVPSGAALGRAAGSGALTGGTAADVRAELEKNRTALAVIVRQVEIAAAGLPPTNSTGWKGPAAWAFHSAVTRLRSEITESLESLHAAQQLTSVAVREVEHGV